MEAKIETLSLTLVNQPEFRTFVIVTVTLNAMKLLTYYRYQTVERRRYQASLKSLLGRSSCFKSVSHPTIPHLIITVPSLYQLSLKISSLTFSLRTMSTKPNGKSIISSSSDNDDKKNGSNPLLSAMVKAKGKAHVSSNREVMFFNDVSLGPQEADLRFRLIHFWEARNPLTKTLIGLEILLIDEQVLSHQEGSKIFLPHISQGSLYTLASFYGSRSKEVFRVAAHSVTISFSHSSELAPLENSHVDFEEDQFLFHSYEDFEAGCDMKGDLFDVIGHLKLVNGQSLNERPFIDDAELATTLRILVHVQSHEGPIMKLYLWDQVAFDFCKKFRSSENTHSVILVTTVYPKRLGDVVTKTEMLTVGEIFSYMKQEAAKDAFFVCTVTIDDVVQNSLWYYIACGGCKKKATKGPTSLMCAKCGKNNVAGEPQYLAKIRVYDKSDEAVFVLFGDAGPELTGKHASELVTEHNLSGRTRVITVMKVLAPSAPPSIPEPVADPIIGSGNGILATGDEFSEPSIIPQACADVGLKRIGDGVEKGNPKRSKDGN
ncbi:hypothetical protein Bca101_020818 [Brassica carinata]